MANQNFSFFGGKQTYSISTTDGDSVTVNVADSTSGQIITTQSSPAKIERLSIVGVPNTGTIAIDPGIVEFGTISVFSLGNGSWLDLGASTATSNVYVTGHSNKDQLTVFDNSGATDATQHHITANYSTLILNGEKSAQSAYVTDLGGNNVWANAGTLEYEIQPSASSAYQSNIFAAKDRGEFIIRNTDPNLHYYDSRYTAGDLSLVLDVAAHNTSGYASHHYTVTQESNASTTIYQKEGVLNFYGQDTTFVLNGQNASVLSSLYLTNNNTLWNGNSTSFVTVEGTQNTIYSAGSGTIVINENNSSSPTPPATLASQNDAFSFLNLFPPSSTSASAPVDQAALPPVNEKVLTIKGVGDTTGRVYYIQNYENVTVSDLKNTFVGILSAGISNIDVGNYTPKGETTFYALSIGSGTPPISSPIKVASRIAGDVDVDVTIKNFTLSQGIDATSHNILRLADDITTTSSFNGKDTVFTLSGASTGRVTFSGVNIAGLDPFTHINSFLPGS